MDPKKQKALAILWAFVACIWLVNVILDLTLNHQTTPVLILHGISWLASTVAAVCYFLSWKNSKKE